MMVARASLKAADMAAASRIAGEVCAALSAWGSWEVRRLEPHHKVPGEFVLYVNVAADRRGDPLKLVRDVARTLASGAWEFHEDDPDEAWAVWDARGGGTPVVRWVTWLCLELLPGGLEKSGPRESKVDDIVRPPQ